MSSKFKMFIDGEWVNSEQEETFEVLSPANGKSIGVFQKASSEDVKKAIDAAEDAQKKIQNMTIPERVKLAYRASELIRPNVETHAKELSIEQGKPIRESRSEMEEAINNLLWQTEDLKRLETPLFQGYGYPDMRYIVTRQPLGVVTVITPWNYPWLMPSEFVIQAIIAGNSVVYKPASTTPLSAIKFIQYLEKAGMPRGIVNLVTGPGASVGQELAKSNKINGLLLVGEVNTGEQITRVAGIKKLTLELGGNGPLIVFDDANLERAVNDTLYGSLTNAGQVCVSNERILVQETVYEKFIKKLMQKARKIKLGDPLKEDTDIGPMNNESGVKKVEMHVKDAEDKGAKILAGGKRATGFPTKLYFEPTIIDEVTEDMLVNKEETFGPVIPVLKFSSVDSAIDLANNTQYGLSMAIETKNLDRAFYVSEKLRTGQVVVNGPVLTWDYHHPWVGVKKSGIGVAGGKWTLEAFSEYKTTLIRSEKPQ